MRVLVTGDSGALGRALPPLATAAGHVIQAPSSRELDLFDPAAVGAACDEVDGILHLATRIRPLSDLGRPTECSHP
jgi:uncharacterized protein YbjT (DUF2867 family)